MDIALVVIGIAAAPKIATDSFGEAGEETLRRGFAMALQWLRKRVRRAARQRRATAGGRRACGAATTASRVEPVACAKAGQVATSHCSGPQGQDAAQPHRRVARPLVSTAHQERRASERGSR